MSLCVVAIAAGAGAAEPFIAIADVETGRALVPEGAVVPAGVRFFVTKHDAASQERVPLVFAYAPAAEFIAARTAIDAVRASAAPPMMRYAIAPEAPAARRGIASDARIITNADPQWFYLYFADGSYTSAGRHVYSSGGWTYYGAGTAAYSAPGGGYLSATIDVSQSSNIQFSWGDPYAYSNSCSVNYSGGSCSTSFPYVGTTQPFSATVDTEGDILQRFPGCWTNPNSPCFRRYTGTIQITFP